MSPASALFSGSKIEDLKSKSWVNAIAIVLLLVVAANQFAAEWKAFRYTPYLSVSADFQHYYLAAKMAGLRGRHRLYYEVPDSKTAVFNKIPMDTEWGEMARAEGIRDTLHFSAPPIVASMLVPLGKLPLKTAFLVWRLLSYLFLFAGTCLCLKLCRALTPITILVCTYAGIMFEPFTQTLDKGQFGALLLLLWSAGTLLAEERNDVLSALMFALATLVKLTPVLALAIFVLRRRWKWVTAYSLWMALFAGVGVWHLGIANHYLFLQRMRLLSCGVPGPYSYSLIGIVQNIHYGTILDYAAMPGNPSTGLCIFGKCVSLIVFTVALVILLKRNRRGYIVWDLAVLALLTLLIAPFTWRHYYVLELFPLMFVWFYLRKGRFSHPRWVLWVAISSTLVAATCYPDYLQQHLSNGPARVFLVALLPLTALLLMATILLAYQAEGVAANTG